LPLVLPILILIYGLPALLIRELWMRGWIGWPGFLLLGAAYAAFNEGIIAVTWFKLDPQTAKVLVFTAAQAGRAAGVNWALVSSLIVYHTIWSMVIPIVLMEAWSQDGRGRPWLPGWALGLLTGVVGLEMLGSLSPESTKRVCAAATAQAFQECVHCRKVAALFIVAAAAVAPLLPRPNPRRNDSVRQPSNAALVVLGACFSLMFLGTFFILPLSGHPIAAQVLSAILLVVAAGMTWRWARSPGWTVHAAALLSAGAILPGMLLSLCAFASLQPVVVALFLVLFLLPALRRAKNRGLAV
jgi:hypothetical protein